MPEKEPGGGTSPGSSPLSQMPDRSGLPSSVRGAAASMFTRPSAARGVEADLVDGHCARSVAGSNEATQTSQRAVAPVVTMPGAMCYRLLTGAPGGAASGTSRKYRLFSVHMYSMMSVSGM